MPTVNYRDHRVYVLDLFQVLHERGPSPPGDIYDEVAHRVGVTAAQRAVGGGEGSWNPVYRNRIQFARQALVDAGVLIGSSEPQWRRGIWELSPEGIALANSVKDGETFEAELQRRAAVGLRKRSEERKQSRSLAGLEEDGSGTTHEPAEAGGELNGGTGFKLAELVDAENDAVLRTMLEHVRGMNDSAFEHLVGTVLKAALRAESVKVTQRSRDGGVDGVLYFDGLGMRVAVFEAKRYAEGNVVGRPQVDAFATAARRRRASHSLFVTSSRFSEEAVETARDEGIRLIEGAAFVELMAQHGIGMRAKDTFVVYEIDPAWSVANAKDGE